MSKYERLPRKLKKQLKKNPEEWEKYLRAKEMSASLDIIFTRNYKHSHRIFQRTIRTGRM